MTPNPDFKVTLSSDAECQKRYNIETSLQWNTARELHMPYSLVLTACCWVTLSELAKYSMTRSITRSICDSWASCYYMWCRSFLRTVQHLSVWLWHEQVCDG